MNLCEEAQSLLEKDYIRNYCILEMLKTSEYHQIDILNGSVFIRLNNNESFVMISASNREDGEALLIKNLRDNDKSFYTINDWPYLTKGKNTKVHSECVQLYLPESVTLAEDYEGIIPLTEDMAAYIHERYDHKHLVSSDYIRERIKIGPAFGVWDHGVLAGWVMSHEEGTMGVLTVLPEFRRKGYAQKLNASMVKSLRVLGKSCLVHIIKGNVPSLTLFRRNGMVYSCDVHWIVLE